MYRLPPSLRPVLLAALLAASCGPAPAPAPTPAPPAPETALPARVRYERMTAHLREQLAAERARRKATVDDNLTLYRQIRRDFSLPETTAAAWSWITKACAVVNAGDKPGEIAWDDRLGIAVVAGREPTALALPLTDTLDLDLRWVEPGSFWMGSPVSERDRGADEVLHEAVITNGYWLGQCEVTQDQWQYVMGHNQCYFTNAGPRAAMESVSYEDLRLFFVRLNTLVQQGRTPWVGILFRLPTEAEWEYACRAGTRTATYIGDLQPKSPNNCPLLDTIAWYGGNAGVTYAGGWDSTAWPDLQFPHTTAGTHPVGLKQPNAWGFHDLLGNVWEWCDSLHVAYAGDAVPTGKETNVVIRGGAWGSGAGPCRAAKRDSRPATIRHNRIGFRVAASWNPGDAPP